MFAYCLLVALTVFALAVQMPLDARPVDPEIRPDDLDPELTLDEGNPVKVFTASQTLFDPRVNLSETVFNVSLMGQPVRNPSINRRNFYSGKGNKNDQMAKGYLPLKYNSTGYISIIVVIVLLMAIFALLFMYVQQRDDVNLANQMTNSHMSDAGHECLQERGFLVKRYLRFHFDSGLPCPENEELGSSGSITSLSLSLSNLTKSKPDSGGGPRGATANTKSLRIENLAHSNNSDVRCGVGGSKWNNESDCYNSYKNKTLKSIVT